MRRGLIETAIQEAVAEAVEQALSRVEEHRVPPAIDRKLIFSRQEAADLLGCSPQTVDRMARDGRLGFVEGVGQGRRYPAVELKEFIKRERRRERL